VRPGRRRDPSLELARSSCTATVRDCPGPDGNWWPSGPHMPCTTAKGHGTRAGAGAAAASRGPRPVSYGHGARCRRVAIRPASAMPRCPACSSAQLEALLGCDLLEPAARSGAVVIRFSRRRRRRPRGQRESTVHNARGHGCPACRAPTPRVREERNARRRGAHAWTGLGVPAAPPPYHPHHARRRLPAPPRALSFHESRTAPYRTHERSRGGGVARARLPRAGAAAHASDVSWGCVGRNTGGRGTAIARVKAQKRLAPLVTATTTTGTTRRHHWATGTYYQ
jgi:hypothetical protein